MRADRTAPGALARPAGRRRRHRLDAFSLAPWVTLALFLTPIVAGLAGTLLPAFGYLPAIGGQALSLAPWRDLLQQPGFITSVTLSVQVGLTATLLSLLLAMAFCALASQNNTYRVVSSLVAPMLATPHVAVAVGFAFLIAPSGWLVRLISPELTGWDRPPIDLVTIRDPQGLSMVAGLLLKEVPYLILMIMAAMNQVPHRQLRISSAGLGYDAVSSWIKCVWPLVYGQVRLPVYAVLAFSMSTVEVGMILAPGNPPPLAVLAARWFSDYDLQRYFPAAAAAVLQALLVLGALLLWMAGEKALGRIGRRWCERGQRGGSLHLGTRVAGAAGMGAFVFGALALLVMVLWSFADAWRYPDNFPAELSLQNWMVQGPGVGAAATTTLWLALATAGVALLLVIGCLENESRHHFAPARRVLWLIYAPLLVPQIAFLYGFQVLLVRMGLDGRWIAVAWAHLVFVVPYVFLSLADPWRALDPRYARTATALGASPAKILLRIRLPMLLRPLLVAFAIGSAVSIGQYLPTLFAGAGRIATLTTEAVTLSSGADRRILGVYTVLQASIPLLTYLVALLVPRLVFRRRLGLV